MWTVIWIAVGGATGAVTRYGVGGAVQRMFADRPGALFPWGTLLINVTGCALMGLLMPLLLERSLLQAPHRMGVLVGFLGAYTTWSTFSIETLNLLNDGDYRHALYYALGTNVGCFVAVWLAYRLSQWMLAGR